MGAAPPLSVIVATTRPWAEVRGRVALLVAQARDVGAELIVADGHVGSPEPELASDVVWLRIPAAPKLELHARALARARGDIVAITEDHAVVGPHWCALVVASHRQHPDVDAVAGAVRNGSTEGFWDRASFLLTFAAFEPPLDSVPASRIPPPTNVSLKRSVVPSILEPGDLEFELLARLHREGRFAVDERIVVSHVEPLSIIGALKTHFHNGRIHGGTYQHERGRQRLRRARKAWQARRVIVEQTRAEIERRGNARRQRREIRGVAVIAWAHTAGMLTGHVAGRGKSARRLSNVAPRR